VLVVGFFIVAGLTITASAFFPQPTVTAAWKLGSDAFELAGMLLVLGGVVVASVKAIAARRWPAAASALKSLLLTLCLLPLGYWLGLFDPALDVLRWFIAQF
jgi:hypothetical protein